MHWLASVMNFESTILKVLLKLLEILLGQHKDVRWPTAAGSCLRGVSLHRSGQAGTGGGWGWWEGGTGMGGGHFCFRKGKSGGGLGPGGRVRLTEIGRIPTPIPDPSSIIWTMLVCTHKIWWQPHRHYWCATWDKRGNAPLLWFALHIAPVLLWIQPRSVGLPAPAQD